MKYLMIALIVFVMGCGVSLRGGMRTAEDMVAGYVLGARAEPVCATTCDSANMQLVEIRFQGDSFICHCR